MIVEKDGAEENAACAAIAERIASQLPAPQADFYKGVLHAAEIIAAEIRARRLD